MQVSAFDFELPENLIAQEPPAIRGGSRLMVLNRLSGAIAHAMFDALGEYLKPGDLLVLNNTRVFPARLLGRRTPSGGAVECLLLSQLQRSGSAGLKRNRSATTLRSEAHTGEGESAATFGGGTRGDASRVGESGGGESQVWDCLMHPGQKLKPGARVVFERQDARLWAEVVGRHFHGRRTIRLWSDTGTDVTTAIEQVGHIPLPPYISREDRPSDRDRYQTVYARERGSVAAPTSGLHFTRELLVALVARGVEQTEITLHVGYGTFRPVRVERVEDHTVEAEHFAVSDLAAAALTRARRDGRRVIAVGTTTARALESLVVSKDGVVHPASGDTSLFIRPGHEFRLVGGLVTNFHLPRSSLLMLVAAFAGREHVLDAYREAILRGYRFYSYGDAMLIV